jgi:hypothetical protein
MNLYYYIHSTLLDAISEKYPKIELSRIRVHYQVSPVNRTYICTAVPRVIMSALGNSQNSSTIAHELVSCINPDLTFINPDIFISDGFINFQVSLSYSHTILSVQPIYDLSLLYDFISDTNFQGKLKRLLDHADSFWPEIAPIQYDQYPLLNQTEIAIITLIAFTEFTDRESSKSFIINGLVSLLKRYYLEVPVFTKDAGTSNVRIRVIKHACSSLCHQIKNAQPTQ